MKSEAAYKTLPFAAQCLIFTILYMNIKYFLPFDPSFISRSGLAMLVALALSFISIRVTSFTFLAAAEFAIFYLIYDLLYAGARLLHFPDQFLTFTIHGFIVPIFWICYLSFGLYRACRIVTTRYQLKTDHALPSGKLKILQLSDTHPHKHRMRAELKRIREITEHEQPDLIVLTGDIFDEYTKPEAFHAYCELFHEFSPKYGTWYVFGNHDTNWRWHLPKHTEEDIRRSFESANIHILEDECAEIPFDGGKIVIAGRRDADEKRMSAAELLKNENGCYIVMLCHEPIELEECAAAGADVTFAGHTHGGQIFPLGRFASSILKMNELRAGIDIVSPNYPNHYAITSSGVGTWGYPVRTEGKSEIVVAEVTCCTHSDMENKK